MLHNRPHPPSRIRAVAMVLTMATTPALSAEEIVELRPFHVESAPWAERTADDLVEPVEILAAESLQRRRSATIGEMIGTEPGIANGSFGPGVGRPIIRGQGGARVQVLENGIRTMDLSTVSADHAVSVDPLNARKVEVIKGPATLLYGSGSSAGIVNVLNNRMPAAFAPGLSGNADFSGSDNAWQRLGSVDLTHGWDRFALQGDASIHRANDFSIPGTQDTAGEGRGGVLENSSMRDLSGGLSGSWVDERGHLGIAVSRLERDYGIPEIIDPEDPEFERIEIDQTRFDLRGTLHDPLPGFNSARIAFGYNRYNQEEIEFEDGERELEAEFRNREWDLRADLAHEPIGRLAGVLGTQFTERDFEAYEADGDAFFIPPSRTRSRAIFVVEEVPNDWGRLEFGGRYEYHKSSANDGGTARFDLYSLSGGTLWELGSLHHFTLRYSRAERAPAPEELFAAGRHAATRTYEIGDPGLSSETANEFDLGFDRHGTRWHWRVNLFYNFVEDYIFQEFQTDAGGNTILVDDDGDPAGSRLRNRLVETRQANAELYGMEAETRFVLVVDQPYRLDLKLFGDTVRGRLTGGRGNLPRITPTRMGVGLHGRWESLDGTAELTRNFSQTRIAEGETATTGHTMLSIDVGYTWHGKIGSRTRLYLRARNLLDEEVRLHTSFLKDESPNPGRAVTAGLRVEF